jgi:DNA mismatch repair ATPase MutS
MGEDTLADWLLKPATTDVIRGRQMAVTELRAQLDLREDFAILGEQSTVGVQPDALLSWINAESRLQQRWIGWAARLLAVSAVIAAIVWFVSGSVSSLLVVLVIETCVAYALRRQFQRTIVAQETTFANLELLSGFLERLERAQFHSPLARHLVQALASHGLKASRAIAKLRTIVQIIESRRNMIVAALDVPLMISIQAAVAAEAWRRKHGHAVESWLRVVGEFEALLSLAAYSYEHPEDPFPEFVADAAAFRAMGIMHPLIPRLNVVANDVDIDDRARIWLVSGSNMSGKSTLLRTVGINVVLAMAGAPVRAQRLEMTALQVGASIRVNDSLQEGSSRFYAEITRLRQLFEAAGGKTPLLVLLDELLQGTNSADRLVGARGVVRALLDRGAIGLVSTHDLALTDIGTANDERIVNVHFQDDMDGGKMKFDYKLRAGVVTKSNALELMRSIGLDV